MNPPSIFLETFATFKLVPKISTNEVEELLDEGVTFVDVRSEEEFADGHVPGALNVPISVSTPTGMQPNENFLKVMEACFEKNQKLVIACKAGGRSSRAVAALTQAGFQDLQDMNAGFVGSKDPFGQPIPGWSAEGREVETTAEQQQTYAALLARAGL